MAAIVMTLPQLDVGLARMVAGIGTRDFAPIWPQLAQMAVSDSKKNITEGHGPNGETWPALAHGRVGQTGALPLRDNGLLLASINGLGKEDGLTVGSHMIYAPVQHYGGTIVPKRSKFLSIPLTIEAKRSGGPRFWTGTKWQFRPTHNGWLMLAPAPMTRAQQRRANNRTFENAARTLEGQRPLRTLAVQRPPAVPQFLLVPSVTIPARPFIGFSPQLLNRVNQRVIEHALDLLGHRLTRPG